MKVTQDKQEIVLDNALLINNGLNDIYISSNKQGSGAQAIRPTSQLEVSKGVYYVYTQADESYLSWFAVNYSSAQSVTDCCEMNSGIPTDYATLTNKPSINGVTLDGDQTTSTLGITDDITAIT